MNARRAGALYLTLVSLLHLSGPPQAEGIGAVSGLPVAHAEQDFAMRMAALEPELEALRREKHSTWDQPPGHHGTGFASGLILAADVLYLRPRRGGLDFAISDPNSDNNVQGHVESLALDSNAGLRGAIGYRTVSGWDLVFRYTHFDTGTSRSVLRPEDGRLWMTRTAPGSLNNDADAAIASASLDLDVFDLEAGYLLTPAPSVPIRIFGGFRAAAIDEVFRVSYREGSVIEERIQRQDAQVDAFGLRAGAETHWRLGRRWSVFGRVAGSVLMGDFWIHYIEDEPAFQTVGNVDLTDRYRDVLPILEAAAGVSWQTGMLTWQAGYEMTAFLNSGQRVNLSGAQSYSLGQMTNVGRDLGLEGFFARLTLNY